MHYPAYAAVVALSQTHSPACDLPPNCPFRWAGLPLASVPRLYVSLPCPLRAGGQREGGRMPRSRGLAWRQFAITPAQHIVDWLQRIWMLRERFVTQTPLHHTCVHCSFCLFLIGAFLRLDVWCTVKQWDLFLYDNDIVWKRLEPFTAL